MGKTYPRVIEKLRREFDEKGVTKYSFCKQTGINPTSVDRYLHGISEPSQASLEKIAQYFEVSVGWLRGEAPNHRLQKQAAEEFDRHVLDLIEIYSLVPEHLKGSVIYFAFCLIVEAEEFLLHWGKTDKEKEATYKAGLEKLETLTGQHYKSWSAK